MQKEAIDYSGKGCAFPFFTALYSDGSMSEPCSVSLGEYVNRNYTIVQLMGLIPAAILFFVAAIQLYRIHTKIETGDAMRTQVDVYFRVVFLYFILFFRFLDPYAYDEIIGYTTEQFIKDTSIVVFFSLCCYIVFLWTRKTILLRAALDEEDVSEAADDEVFEIGSTAERMMVLFGLLPFVLYATLRTEMDTYVYYFGRNMVFLGFSTYLTLHCLRLTFQLYYYRKIMPLNPVSYSSAIDMLYTAFAQAAATGVVFVLYYAASVVLYLKYKPNYDGFTSTRNLPFLFATLSECFVEYAAILLGIVAMACFAKNRIDDIVIVQERKRTNTYSR